MGDAVEKNRIFLYSSLICSRRVSHECLGKAVAHYIASGAYTASEDSGSSDFPAGPPSGWRLERETYGKPCFPDAPSIHFSISHSGGFWVCAISGQQVGVDIQERRWKGERAGEDADGGERIAGRFFHPQERQFLARRASETPGGNREEAEVFFDIWSAKESYVKYTGEGIRRDFGSFAVSDQEGLLSYINTPSGGRVMLRHLPWDPAYSLCICAKKIGEIRQIRL